MKKLLFLLAMPCLALAQRATTYDLTQDKLINSHTSQIKTLTGQWKSQNDRQNKIDRNDSINRLITIPALKKQISDLQSSISTVIGQNATLLGQYAAMVKQMNEVQQVAVTALLEANKKDTFNFSTGFTIDTSGKKKAITVTNYTEISTAGKTAAKASADVTDMATKLSAALQRIAALELLTTKLK